MSGYLIKFIFYTAGVIGILLIGYVVAKNFMLANGNFKKKKGNLDIEESLPIAPKKTLHIVKAFGERFLIAADATSTTMLAKLNVEDLGITEETEQNFNSYIEEPKSTRRKSRKDNGSVIKSMLNKLDN